LTKAFSCANCEVHGNRALSTQYEKMPLVKG
jgi:hypothetical protein